MREIDLANRMSPVCDLKFELSSGRVGVLTKLIARPFAIPERGDLRLASTIIYRNNSSGITKIGPSYNRPTIGV